ncbi:hypothetical protein MBM_00296 [Drepanopeziza brunnea f. sp. 'multigermtubi' MB_m1]|uniref:DUF1682 domain protein n=1 Tax=Marssonina brunnea f. sp. multigermtubi (strain MB_m1) TaxID=1072389 RepID=K1XKS9_MARBU|nr:uncharacterized protein MBM_00296 [Drepanopeziza brunnea f. sp. 'multigermtubi' MB_m1]EKD21183.1 hypothetical protein MBM_00296 [Drepanopeziza brunnea f. sp. 'multigermtubi' MB_m1]
MAALFKALFGGSNPSASPIPAGDSGKQALRRNSGSRRGTNPPHPDFADFASAPEPAPAAFAASSPVSFMRAGAAPTGAAVPYTKWYNIHERHSLGDFKQEAVIIGLILIIIMVHILGTSSNRKRAKAWIDAHATVLQKEFALVGFGGRRAPDGATQILELPEDLLKEKAPNEFATYATGRQNVAFVDVTLTLFKRYSPLTMFFEFVLSLFFDSMQAPVEKMEAVLYPFDGREALTITGQVPGAHEVRKDTKSNYDGFVWAIVNKETMKQLREERYDVSITSTKDSPKLPSWATVMSESAEITDFLLTPELIQAIENAGELFNHLIITDQPIDRPLKLEETAPKKRIYLSLRIPSSDFSPILSIFQYFIRVTDILAQSAHFRPEVLRKVRNTRDELIRKLQKADDDVKAEERNIEKEKAKKVKRDLELKALDAKGQKKFLEREREKELRKNQKKYTSKG